MRLRWWLVAVLVGLGATPALAAEHRLAVLPIDLSQLESRPSRARLDALEETLRDAVAGALPPTWTLVSSTETLKAIAELGLHPSDCGDGACHFRVAQGVQARNFLSLSLLHASDDFLLRAEMKETREGRQIAELQVTAPLASLASVFAARLEDFYRRAGILSFREEPKVVVKPKARIRRNLVEPKTRQEYAYFEGGAFRPGCEPKDEQCLVDEKELAEVNVADFWLAKREVTVRHYEQCVQSGACNVFLSNGLGTDRCNWNRKASHPMNCIRYEEAREFCQWLGGDLPSADEWELAAKDGGGRVYPWGSDEPTPERVVMRAEETSAPGTKPKGASPAGVLDLAGNVAEWTTSPSAVYGHRQIRGGAYNSEPRWLRASARGSADEGQGQDTIGFRCRLPVK